jgi:hypothetical protein
METPRFEIVLPKDKSRVATKFRCGYSEITPKRKAIMTLQEKLAKVNTELEAHSAEYRSGQSNSAPLLKKIKVLVAKKVRLLEELRTA